MNNFKMIEAMTKCGSCKKTKACKQIPSANKMLCNECLLKRTIRLAKMNQHNLRIIK